MVLFSTENEDAERIKRQGREATSGVLGTPRVIGRGGVVQMGVCPVQHG